MARPLYSAALLLALLLTHADVRAACPTNYGSCVTPTTAPIGGFNTLCPESGRASVFYDLTQGLIRVELYDGGYGASTDLHMADVFTLQGLPDGTPVTFTLELVVQGRLFAWRYDGHFGYQSGATFRAGLDDDPSISIAKFIQSSHFDTGEKSLDINESVVQVATRNAGQPFTVVGFGSTGGIGAYANVWGKYRFHNLPPGVSVTSCQGYVPQDPTPTSPRSWGRVKVLYR